MRARGWLKRWITEKLGSKRGQKTNPVALLHQNILLLFSRSVLLDSFVTLWTVTCRAPLSMGSPRQEYWSGLPFSPPEDLPDPGMESVFPALAGGFFTAEPAGQQEVLNVHLVLAPSSSGSVLFQILAATLDYWENKSIESTFT